MKKVQIRSATMPDKSSILTKQKRFTILLGNGVKLSYSTKKDLNYALAEINRTLNVITFELNEMWIFAFTEYRRLWFYLPSGMMGVNDRAMLELHQDINRAFHLLTERSNWTNGNVFSFKYLFQIIDALTGQLRTMAEMRRDKKHYIEFHLMEMKIKTVERIRTELKELSVDAKYASSAQ